MQWLLAGLEFQLMQEFNELNYTHYTNLVKYAMLELQELQDKTPEELSQIILSLQASQKQFIDKITLQEDTLAQEAELNKRKTLIDILYEQIHLLKHSCYSSSSERYVDDNPQGRLFDEVQAPSSDELDAIKEADESITVPEHQRKKRGRKPLPTDLLRVEIMHDLADEDKQCDCGCNHLYWRCPQRHSNYSR